MKNVYILISGFVFFAVILSVIGFSIYTQNQMNNTNTIENITFNGSQNVTRYVTLPFGANITNATLNISGFSTTTKAYNVENISIENSSTESPYSINDINTWLNLSTNVEQLSNSVDATATNYTIIYNTSTQNNSLFLIYYFSGCITSFPTQNIRFEVFNLSIWNFTSSTWIIVDSKSLDGNGINWTGGVNCISWPTYNITHNVTELSDFFSGYVVRIKLYISIVGGNTGIGAPRHMTLNGSGTTYGSILNHTTNPYIETGTPDGKAEFNWTGNLTTTNGTQIANLNTTVLNNTVLSCSVDNSGNCQVPIIFHSDSKGILQYSNILINYTNTQPSIKNQTLNITNLGGLHSIKVIVNVTDVENNYQNCSIGGNTSIITSNISMINLSTTLTQDLTSNRLNCSDILGAFNTTTTFNFTLSNNTISENSSFAHNLSFQRIQKNDSLYNGGGGATLSYIINYSRYGNTTSTIAGENFSGLLSSSGNDSFITVWEGDWLVNKKFGDGGNYTQDVSRTSEAGGVAYINRSLNVTNTIGVYFASVNVSSNSSTRSGWSCSLPNIIVNSSGYFSISYENCTNTSILTRVRTKFNVTSATNITVGSNYSGFMELLTNNTDVNISFINVLVNGTPNLPSIWQMQTNETNTTNITNMSFSLVNFTINTTQALVQEAVLDSNICPAGAIIGTYYCIGSADFLNGSNRITTYTALQQLNVTENTTQAYDIWYPIALSRLTSWSSRINGTENLTINTSSTNLTMTENSSTLINIIGNNHLSTGSLSQGLYTIKVTYQVSTSIGGGSGGIGGGGVGSVLSVASGFCGNNICDLGENKDNCPQDCGGIGWYLTPEFWRVPVTPGVCIEKDFVINNNGTLPLELSVRMIKVDNSVEWTTLKSEDSQTYTKELSLNIPAGTISFPGRKRFFIKTCPPEGILNNESTKEFRVNIETRVGDTSRISPFGIVVGSFPDVVEFVSQLLKSVFKPLIVFPQNDLLNFLVTPAFYLFIVIPVIGISSILSRKGKKY